MNVICTIVKLYFNYFDGRGLELNILPKNESLKKSNLKGTFEIKKKNWSDGRYISFEDRSDNRGVNLFSCSEKSKIIAKPYPSIQAPSSV